MMKKLIACQYWKEYQGMNGWLMFCSAGAFGKKFRLAEAVGIGCTPEQRAVCKKTMEINMGYSLLPEIVDLVQIKKKVKNAVVAHSRTV